MIWIFQYICMLFRRTYRCYDTFTNTGDDCRFTSTTNEAVNISTYRYASTNLKFNTIFCHCRNNRCFNNLRINGHLNRFQYITTCEVDSGRTFKCQRNRCAFSSNQSIYNAINVTTSKIMCFQLIYINLKAGFIRLN